MAQIITTEADVALDLNASPFNDKQPVVLSSLVAANVYGAFNPGRSVNDNSHAGVRCAIFAGDGAKTTWDEDDIALLANAQIDGGTLDTDDILRVVLTDKNGVMFTRVAASATPAAGEFKTQDNAGKTELVIGEAIGDKRQLELYVLEASDIVAATGGALTAHRRYEYQCPRWIVTDAVCELERLVN